MKLAFKYRLYPNSEQHQALNRILEIHRQVYNDALKERREAWERCRVSIRYTDQANQLKPIRTFDTDVAWCNYSSLQQTLRRLDKAFQAFFRRVKAGKEKPGYPRFKGKSWFRSICYVYRDGTRLKNGRLYIQNVGLVRIFQHRPIPDDAKIKMVVLKRDKVGNWYAVFQIEVLDACLAVRDEPAVGIDMGLEHFAALSTGELVDNPRWFRQAEEKVATLQRRRARCRRGSRKDKELSRQIAALHRDITRKRHDFHHQLSTRLVNEYTLIAIEDLNIKGLAKSHVSKSIGDAGWGQFVQMLEYKAQRAGIRLVKVNPNGTSQICSNCGRHVQKSLSVRTHHCPHCGFVAQRDVNAALNILGLGQSLAVKCSSI